MKNCKNKLAEKTNVTPYKASDPEPEPQSKPERKKWGEPKLQKRDIQSTLNDVDNMIDQLNSNNDNYNNSNNIPVYETSPENLDQFESDTLRYKHELYKPDLDSIMENSNEYTLSKGLDLLSQSEKKMMQEQLRNNN